MAREGRGTRTHGHGSHKRKAGRRGGSGYAGMKSAKWIKTIKGGKTAMGIGSRRGRIGHFGKYGFTRGSLGRQAETVNLSWLEERFPVGETINLRDHGVDKLLGAGRLTKKFTVVVPTWSSKAEQKIKAAGGNISTGEQE